MHGHDVDLYDARPKAGGLNEYGIAAYKSVDGFAQAEVDWLISIGGITTHYDAALGRDLTLDALTESHNAVFLGIGLGGVNALGIDGDARYGVRNAVDFIADLRQAADLSLLPVGRRVVVIGGGMTAVDAAVQSRLLGAEEVTMVYRRGPDAMGASAFERDLAASKGVRIVFNAQPVRIDGNGAAASVVFEYTEDGPQGLQGTGETFSVQADQVLRAIGQALEGGASGVELDGRRIRVDAQGRTSRNGVWAGGDCVNLGDDLTVTAVAQGRDAAEDIHRAVSG